MFVSKEGKSQPRELNSQMRQQPARTLSAPNDAAHQLATSAPSTATDTEAVLSARGKGSAGSWRFASFGRGLYHSKSQPDLQVSVGNAGEGKKAKKQNARSAARAENLAERPALPVRSPSHLSDAAETPPADDLEFNCAGVGRRAFDLLRRSPSPLPSPKTPTLASFQAAATQRPPINERAYTLDFTRKASSSRLHSPLPTPPAVQTPPLPASPVSTQRSSTSYSTPSRSPYGAPLGSPTSPQARGRTGQSSRPSTASSYHTDFIGGHRYNMSVSTAPTGLSSEDEAMRSSKASVHINVLRDSVAALSHASLLQEGWMQDDMLAAVRSCAQDEGRLLQDIVLGAMPEQILDMLASSLALPANVVELLTLRCKYLHDSRTYFGAEGRTFNCRLALMNVASRIKDSAPSAYGPRPDGTYGRLEKPTVDTQVQTAKNSVVRFLFELINLRVVLTPHNFILDDHQLRRLRADSVKLPLRETRAILEAVGLNPAQKRHLDAYLDRCGQLQSMVPATDALEALGLTGASSPRGTQERNA